MLTANNNGDVNGPSTFTKGYVNTRAKLVVLKTHDNLLELSSTCASPPLVLMSSEEDVKPRYKGKHVLHPQKVEHFG